MLDVVAAFARAPTPREREGCPPWLERARDLLESHLTARVLLSDVARQVGVSASHLNRSFRRFYGQSAGSYLRARRLELAAQMLRDETKPLSLVALETGFCDQSHFTSAFKARFGVTPARYRTA